MRPSRRGVSSRPRISTAAPCAVRACASSGRASSELKAHRNGAAAPEPGPLLTAREIVDGTARYRGAPTRSTFPSRGATYKYMRCSTRSYRGESSDTPASHSSFIVPKNGPVVFQSPVSCTGSIR
jgi:hypothetical protein